MKKRNNSRETKRDVRFGKTIKPNLELSKTCEKSLGSTLSKRDKIPDTNTPKGVFDYSDISVCELSFFDVGEIEKRIEKANSVKFKNCIVCLKLYSLKQSDTKRYCSRKCSDIAMRVRDWENKRGMNLRVLQAQLKTTQRLAQKVGGEIDEMLKRNDDMVKQGKVLPKNIRIPFINGEELKSSLFGDKG